MNDRSVPDAPEIAWASGAESRTTLSARRMALAIGIACAGVAVLAAAFAADQAWFDRHFLPSFFLPRRWYWFIYVAVRWLVAAVGAGLLVAARPLAARLTRRATLRGMQLALAGLLALGAAELVLSRVHLQPTEWLLPAEEPRRRPDPRLGWTFVPGRVGHATVGGRALTYALDANGYRVRSTDEPVDLHRVTIVFAGESVMFGEGLPWNETIPAQVTAMTSVQSANLAVHGYSSDQAYLRLQDELPRFSRPVAVVSLFMTALFGRNLDDDRPHLGGGLAWLPAERHARLRSLAMLLVPYRSDDAVQRAVSRTREVFRATVQLAHARGARALIVVPQFGAETQLERSLRRRILDEEDLPYVFVPIDEAWRLPWDRHPNALAARTIAAAVAARLRVGPGPGLKAGTYNP